MTTVENRGNEVGASARLQRALKNVPDEQIKSVRELAQKECEADLKANDALLVRSNQLLAATGVALTLLIGLAKDVLIASSFRCGLFIVLLATAGIAAVAIMLSLVVRSRPTQMENINIVGEHVNESKEPLKWQRDHELSMALAYLEIRLELEDRHRVRASLLRVAQCFYLAYIVEVIALGIAVAL